MYRKVYIRGGEHPPRHQQALPLRHPIPVTLPPRFRGFGECFEPRQTKPAGSGELGRFPQLQGLGGTGQPEQWGSPPPPRFAACSDNTRPVAGSETGRRGTCRNEIRRESFGFPVTSLSPRSPGIRYETPPHTRPPPRGLHQEGWGGQALSPSHPAPRSQLPMEPDPGGLDPALWRAGTISEGWRVWEGAGRAVLPSQP